MAELPLDSWEPWRRGASGGGFDPTTRMFPEDIDKYGQIPSARYTAGHSTSSLARVKAEDIERSTKIVSVDAASHLAGYEDPIKLILPPVLQEANVVYVKRKFAVGNVATEVPERAPAPVVSVQEETRRVALRRYGGDIDFNVNSCAVPDLFQREMDLKVGAQHAALADRLVALGYETLIAEGTDFTSALMRSNHGLDSDVRARARRFYFEQVFGCLSTNPYPIHNLLAAAKRCTAYDISKSLKSVLILPHGVPEMMSYTRAENMRYEVNGIAGPQGKPITMKVDSGYNIPATTAKVFVHIPPAMHLHGSAAPVAGTNSLEEIVKVYHTYNSTASSMYFPWTQTDYATYGSGNKSKLTYYVDAVSRQHRKLGDSRAGLLYNFDSNTKTLAVHPGRAQLAYRKEFMNTDTFRTACTAIGDNQFTLPRQNVNKIVATELNTMHAILATPGEETGNLLMQYPRSTVSADASTESGRMQLRVYMGAVLKRPENVLVMRNVAFNGIRDQVMLGCKKDDTNQTVKPYEVFESSQRELIETQGCLFPSTEVIQKLAKPQNDVSSYKPAEDEVTRQQFFDRLNRNGGIVKELTQLEINTADYIEITSNLSIASTVIQTSAPHYFRNAAEAKAAQPRAPQTYEIDKEASRLFLPDKADIASDYYPPNLKGYGGDGTGAETTKITANEIDTSSTILRTIMLNASDEALEEQRDMDHELGISEDLTEAYIFAVSSLRDRLRQTPLPGTCGQFHFTTNDNKNFNSPPMSLVNVRGAADNTPCEAQVRGDYYRALKTNKLGDTDLSLFTHPAAMNWLHRIAANGTKNYLANDEAFDGTRRGNLEELISKDTSGDYKLAWIKPGVNADISQTTRGGLDPLVEATILEEFYKQIDPTGHGSAASSGTFNPDDAGVKESTKLRDQVNHYNNLIGYGLQYTDMCAEVLYLFSLITQKRNAKMQQEKYRFGSGAVVAPKDNVTVDFNDKDSLVPYPVSVPYDVTSTVPNMGQFRSVDNIDSLDKFNGMALQRYQPNSDRELGGFTA